MRVNRFDTPGYREAVERETAIRDTAFLDLATDICGVEIRQMSAQDYLVLDGLGSPFLIGELPYDYDIVSFLWQLSPKRSNWWLSQYWFANQCGRRLRDKPVIERIQEYVRDTFQDAPGSSAGGHKPSVGWMASLVDAIATEYGWSEFEIMNLPLRRSFQYLKRIRQRTDPNAITFNPSDALISKHLRMKRERKKLLDLLQAKQ